MPEFFKSFSCIIASFSSTLICSARNAFSHEAQSKKECYSFACPCSNINFATINVLRGEHRLNEK